MNVEDKPSVAESRSLYETAFTQNQRLRDDPNVCAVGQGPKRRDGSVVAAECLVFFVKQKAANAREIDALGSSPIPDQIEGYPTDVVEIGSLKACASDRSPPTGERGTRIADPLIGGSATAGLGASSIGPGSYGTLGGLCFDTLTRSPGLLSNAHVWGTTAGVEVVQPPMPARLLGARVSPAAIGSPPQLVQTRLPSGLTAPMAFANAVAQAYLITGSGSDPLPVGQSATQVPSTTRTDGERVTIASPEVGPAPAGRRISPELDWEYQRVANTAVKSSSSKAQRPATQVLTARRVFTNSASYSSGQTVNMYAEIIPAAGGAPSSAAAHWLLALLFPLATGDKFIPRVLRPVARQAVTTVTISFLGFPAPARAGTFRLPAFAGTSAAPFGVDAQDSGSFETSGGATPAGTFILKLPSGSVSVFVPICSQVVLDIDMTGMVGPLQVIALNSAQDVVSTTFTTSAGIGSRSLVTVSASEIVEVRLAGVANTRLYGVTAKRSSPEATAPLAYAASVGASELLPKGKWAISLVVQAADTGLTESANIVPSAIGLTTLASDCTFDIT